MLQISEQEDLGLDGKQVKYVGIINSIKKKYTKRNTLMAFMSVEDLYGSTEIIVFDSCFSKAQNILLEENIVLIDGRLSIREDEPVKIVANNITEFNENVVNQNFKDSKRATHIEKQNDKPKLLTINITNISEEQKDKLRGAIRFFSGDRNNIAVSVQDGEKILPCGAIYLTQEILNAFKEIVGEENIKI